jgi:hypothetical protein
MGELTLTKVINGDCTKPPFGALYPLTISRGEVRFAYRPRFDTTLSGTVDEPVGILSAPRLSSPSFFLCRRVPRGTVNLVEPAGLRGRIGVSSRVG